ncbi:MAG: hypothetical protein F6K14_01585 [Symploca sp. SIO2C1]|nr:hypothetical protein [Symploca sp. SIO2C1]
MKTLLTLFSKERGELQTAIDQTTSPEQVVRLVQSRLDHLQKSYIGELSVAQVRLASFFLDAVRQSIATLAGVNEVKASELEPEVISKQVRQFSSKSIVLKVLQGVICLGILDSLFSLAPRAPIAWMDILLISLLVGLEVISQLDKNTDKNSDGAHPVVVQVDSQVLLDKLAEALNTIDLAVTIREESPKSLESSGIEELPELLNILQRLVGASLLEKPQMALELTKLLPQVLMEQGIHSQTYQSDDVQSNREYFDFEPSINPKAKDYITITPALLKGDRLLRRGRVIEPVSSEARD